MTRGARARAAIIAFLVFFNTLAALPTPGEPSPERMQRPFEQAELRRWAAFFQSLGVEMDPERLARGYLAFSRGVEQARAVALAPIAGWQGLTLTHQGWRLFGTPDRVVTTLRVTAHSASGDEVLYESGNPARRWNAAFLEYRRIRADYNPSRRGPPPTYAAFGQRLGAEIFATMPQVVRVSVALVDTRTRLPHEPASPQDSIERVEHVLELARPGT